MTNNSNFSINTLVKQWDLKFINLEKTRKNENPFLRYKRREIIAFIRKWVRIEKNDRILKTDLWEEAFGPDECLIWIAKHGVDVFGIDISPAVVEGALKNFDKMDHGIK